MIADQYRPSLPESEGMNGVSDSFSTIAAGRMPEMNTKPPIAETIKSHRGCARLKARGTKEFIIARLYSSQSAMDGQSCTLRASMDGARNEAGERCGDSVGGVLPPENIAG